MKKQIYIISISTLRKISAKLIKILFNLYRKIFRLEWEHFSPQYFDHKIDLFYQWPKNHDCYFLKRGVYSNFFIEKFDNAKVMELCCGDGFNTFYFYSPENVSQIIACDYLSSAIRFAKKNYSNNKIKFIEHDLYSGLPSLELDFTNVVWDAAINYFEKEEILKLLAEIKNCLDFRKGIFSGTVQYNQKGELWNYYKTNFASENEFTDILKSYFKNIKTSSELRGNEYTVYFAATNGDSI